MMKIAKREKLFVIGGGIFIAVFVLIVGIVMPLLHHRVALTNSIVAKDQQLKMVYDLSAKISALERANRASSGMQKNFTLFGFLEDLAKKQGINERIEYMKPVAGGVAGAESIEVRIKGIYEEELIGFLYGVETCPTPLRVKRLNLRRVDKDKNLDVTFQVQVHG
jgi:type II secretory pathway component PulM